MTTKIKSGEWGVKEWVKNWKEASSALQDQRDQDIKNSDTESNMEQLDWCYQYLKSNYPVSDCSGMVEFYKILLKDKA